MVTGRPASDTITAVTTCRGRPFQPQVRAPYSIQPTTLDRLHEPSRLRPTLSHSTNPSTVPYHTDSPPPHTFTLPKSVNCALSYRLASAPHIHTPQIRQLRPVIQTRLRPTHSHSTNPQLRPVIQTRLRPTHSHSTNPSTVPCHTDSPPPHTFTLHISAY